MNHKETGFCLVFSFGMTRRHPPVHRVFGRPRFCRLHKAPTDSAKVFCKAVVLTFYLLIGPTPFSRYFLQLVRPETALLSTASMPSKRRNVDSLFLFHRLSVNRMSTPQANALWGCVKTPRSRGSKEKFGVPQRTSGVEQIFTGRSLGNRASQEAVAWSHSYTNTSVFEDREMHFFKPRVPEGTSGLTVGTCAGLLSGNHSIY
jgi:hypothetical protein